MDDKEETQLELLDPRPTSDDIVIGIPTTASDDSNPHQPSNSQESLEHTPLTQIDNDITAKDVSLISVFGVILPSVDQGTDYYTAATLIHFGFECHGRSWCADPDTKALEDSRVRRYGYAMLAPILLMTIFSLRQWWRLEKSWNRLWTLPLVLLQVFPQYRALRILYLGLRKKASWRAEKDVYDRDLTSLEPYLESIPQIHILICLIVSNDRIISGSVLFTLALSIFSGGFGIAKFMKTGPCKMVPNTSGFLDGFVSLGFPAVVFSVIATFVGKGLLLPVVANDVDGSQGLAFYKVAIWMALNLLPQLIYACCVLWATLGFKKAAKACLNYPALVLTTCFGSWTFGPAARNNESTSTSNSKCCMSCESNKIRVSYKHTWISYGISLIGHIVTFFLGYKRLPYFASEIPEFFRDGFFGPRWVEGAILLSWMLIIVVLPILIGFVQAVDKCQKYCTCCPTECFPVIQRTELDVDNMD